MVLRSIRYVKELQQIVLNRIWNPEIGIHDRGNGILAIRSNIAPIHNVS